MYYIISALYTEPKNFYGNIVLENTSSSTMIKRQWKMPISQEESYSILDTINTIIISRIRLLLTIALHLPLQCTIAL